MSKKPGVKRANAAYWLLILPFLGTLLPFVYNREGPALFGMPFFYWYQLAWVLITAALLGVVVYFTRGSTDDR